MIMKKCKYVQKVHYLLHSLRQSLVGKNVWTISIIGFKISHKRDFILEKQLPRWVMKYTKCLSLPFPFMQLK